MEGQRASGRRYPLQDVKVLWGLSAGRCAFPGCREICIVPAIHEDGPAVIGDIAHIVAHADRGPRADRQFPSDQLDTYANWIVLCATHHRLVDARPTTYPVSLLREWKARHEAWVVERLGGGFQRGVQPLPPTEEVVLYRVARASQDPWHPPIAASGPIGRRWDAPSSSYRVRYAASSPELAFAEVFDGARHVPARELDGRVIATAHVRGRFADLRHNALLQQALDERLAVLVGPVSPAELSLSARFRRTQEMSRLIFEDGTWDGIIYSSANATPERGKLYALFDTAEAFDVQVHPLRSDRADADCQQ